MQDKKDKKEREMGSCHGRVNRQVSRKRQSKSGRISRRNRSWGQVYLFGLISNFFFSGPNGLMRSRVPASGTSDGREWPIPTESYRPCL